MTDKSALGQIKELALQGMEGCDEPQFSILSKIVGITEEQAQKPTEPAGLVEELLNACTKSEEAIFDPQVATVFTRWIRAVVSRYRPAPSSDEGLREVLNIIEDHQKKYVEQYEIFLNSVNEIDRQVHASRWNALERVKKELLSRHPAPKDRCADHFVEVNKLVKRLREHISDQKLKEADYLVYDEIEAIINEFEKDADGKETTK